MKKFLSIFFFFSSTLLHADVLLNETFNTSALPTGWTNTVIQGAQGWSFRNSPIFSSPSSGGYAVFDDQLLGAAVTPNEASLITPSVDFTNRTTAFLKISHHWFGVEFTHGFVELSNDGGTTWNTLIDYHKLTRGSLATPQDTTFDITALAANQANVSVRFRYTDGGQAGRYWYLDDIVLYSNPDVGITQLVLPNYLACAQTYGAAETVTVEITNYSIEPVTNIPITCEVTGGTTITLTGTYSGAPIPGLGTVTYTFASTINMTTDAAYHFLCYTSLGTDSYILNDSLLDGRQQYVQAYPYTADFNISNAGWFATGTNPPLNNNRNFEHGAVPYLNGSQGEGKSFYVNATTDAKNDKIWVESPVFDFSGLTNPHLTMEIKHSLVNTNNRYQVDYSINGGATWVKLGTNTDPNWYNTTSGWSNSISTPVDNWEEVQKSLCVLAGQSCVKFRVWGQSWYGDPRSDTWYSFAFDNFVIRDGPDVSVIAYIDPVDIGCLFDANADVTVRIFNLTCNTVTNIPIQSDITGQITTTLNGTVPGPIPVGGFVDYTFPTTINMTAVGIYNFNTFTTMPSDINLSNDTLGTTINITNLKVTSYPYLEDFNSGAGFWNATGTNPPLNNNRNFVLGVVPYLGGPQGQGDSWYVDPTTDAKNDKIWVESPVFDFSNLTNPKLSFDLMHSLVNTNNRYQVEYSLDGGAWIKLGTNADSNWYNTTSGWSNSISSPVAVWTKMEHELCILSGESCVKFRIWGQSWYGNPRSNTWYSFAFDNFAIDAGHPDDIEPIEIILSDAGDCASFSATEAISVVIKNNTCRPLFDVPVDLQLNGGVIISEIIPGPIPRFGNYIYNFTATLDLSPASTHSISVTTNLVTDSFPGNDTKVQIRLNPPGITTFPYMADFNTNNNGWVSRTTDSSRLFRNDVLPYTTDTTLYLNGPQGEGKSWYVEPTTDAKNTKIWVESPVFDFTGVTNPQLLMDVKHSLVNSNNRYQVDYSINGGTTWVKLGTNADPNWYNTTSGWTSSISNPVDTWTTMQHSLCMLADSSCVKFRVWGQSWYGPPRLDTWYSFAFDNFVIRDGPDVGVIAYIDPVDEGCLFGQTQQVTVVVYNWGCDSVTNIPIQSNISGAITDTLIGTILDTIPPGDTVSYTFPISFNMTGLGIYNFNTFTSMIGDVVPENDGLATSINVNILKVTTYPYLEDFNSGTGFWTATGTNPPLNNNRNFVLGVVPYLGGPQGQGDSWYVDPTTDAKNDKIWVESPVFDFTNLTNPKLSFDLMHSLVNTNNRYQVEYSLDGGAWNKLGTNTDPNWYNTTSGWSNSISSPVAVWTKMEHELCFLSGEPCVKFRVWGQSWYGDPRSDTWYSFAFDNFAVDAGHPDDISPIEIILSDAGDCASFSATEAISVVIQNNTCRPLFNVPIDLQLNGGGIISEIIPGPIPRFGNYIYNFTATLDLSPAATHSISVTTNLVTDSFPGNDNLVQIRLNPPGITVFPYTANFDTDNDGWVSRTSEASRLFRNEVVPYLGGAQGQGKSWYVEPTTDAKNTKIWVESPVFDFSALTNPQLTMDIKHSLVNTNNRYQVDYSINGGTSWVKLGTNTDPNWYNTTSGWSNSISTPVSNWESVQKSLCVLAGQSCVKFRVWGQSWYGPPRLDTWYSFAFDNFVIRDGPDVGITAYIGPTLNGCLYSITQQVTVTVFNWGCNPATNVPVQSDITGQITTSLIGTVPGPIPAGGSVNYTFPTSFNMQGIGTYNFNTYTKEPSDFNTSNDTLATTLIVAQPIITTFPYYEDFNSGANFWISTGTNPPLNNNRNFVLGAVPYLGGPQGQGDSWYVDPTTDAKNDKIWVESPVFNFSSLVNPQLSFDLMHSLINTNNRYQVEYSLNGGTTWVKLGTNADPNWYNTTSGWSNSISSPVSSWSRMEHDLCILAGESCVKLRIWGQSWYGNPRSNTWYSFAFDNFHITDTPLDAALDLAVSCWGSEFQIDVTVQHISLPCVDGEILSSSLGVVTTNSEYVTTSTAGNAFDGDKRTFGWGNNNSLPAWLDYDFGGGNNKVVDSYSIYCSGVQNGRFWNTEAYNPSAWTFEAWNGASWVVLHTVAFNNTNVTRNNWATFSFTNTTAYQKYRINITQSESTNWTHITEMRLIKTNVITDIDLTYTIDGSAPTTVSFSGLNILSGGDTLLTLPNTTVPTNASTLQVWATFPNGFNDQIFENDTVYGVVANFPNCNDHCSNAIDLGLGTTTATQNSNGTVDLLEDPLYTACGSPTLENTVWYQFTTNSSGDSVTVLFDQQICAPSQNGIQISIDSVGTACDFTTYANMYCSATNDTGAVQYGPVLLPPNTTYYIAIDGFAGSDCAFDITITGAVNPPLPIQLLFFDAQCGKEVGSTEIKWQSATEINNDFYTIERSTDAINFEAITTIDGAGNSNNVNSYYFKDVNIPSGKVYYRLKQTDFNGNFEYFNVRVVDCGVASNISIYPNPTTADFTLNISGEKDAKVLLEMYNSTGQKVVEKNFKLENESLNELIITKELTEGIYFVNIFIGNQLETKKLVIER